MEREMSDMMVRVQRVARRWGHRLGYAALIDVADYALQLESKSPAEVALRMCGYDPQRPEHKGGKGY